MSEIVSSAQSGMVEMLAQYVGLAGIGALIAVLVNLVKYTGVIADGDSLKWASAFNMVGFAAYWAVGLFNPDLLADNIGTVDEAAGMIASAASIIIAIVIQFGSSPAVQNILRGIPVIGKSLSAEE